MSGVTIDQTITFAANGALSQNITFTLTDDSVTDEPNEIYSLSLSNPSSQVTLGNPTSITIIDDDNGSAQECFIIMTVTVMNLLQYSRSNQVCPEHLLI